MLWAGNAVAQSTRRIAAYDGTPAADDHGFIHMPGTAAPGHLRGSFTAHNELTLGEFRLPATGEEAVRWRDRLDLLAQFGLGDRWALALAVPLALFQAAGDNATGPALPSTVLLDPQVRGRYRLFGATTDGAGERADGPGLAIAAAAHLPLGHDFSFAGEGALRAEVQAIADFQVLGAGVGAQIGLRHRFDHHNLEALRLRDALTYGLALKVPMPFWPLLAVITELQGASEFTGEPTHPLMWLLGARVHLDSWSVLATVGLGLRGQLASPDATLGLGIRYSPAAADSDHDGIDDDDDACPFLPEDRDGFEDDDGCEDPDNDNDWVPDLDDLCPNVEALEGQDADEDGCTDP